MALVIGSKLSVMTSHAWTSKSSQDSIHFYYFFVIVAQLMRFSFNRSNLPGENMSKYKH